MQCSSSETLLEDRRPAPFAPRLPASMLSSLPASGLPSPPLPSFGPLLPYTLCSALHSQSSLLSPFSLPSLQKSLLSSSLGLVGLSLCALSLCPLTFILSPLSSRLSLGPMYLSKIILNLRPLPDPATRKIGVFFFVLIPHFFSGIESVAVTT